MSFESVAEQIARGPKGPSIGAFFDFDGTLIQGYSASALYAHRLRSGEIGLPELFQTVRLMSGPTLGEDEFVGLVNRGLAGWRGRGPEELEDLGNKLLHESIAGSLFHETWRLVKAHQRQGHTVVVASSATRLQVEPLARELGIENILSTQLGLLPDGTLSGAVAGRSLWGPGKAAAVLEFAEQNGIDLVRSSAYANGNEDVPFLEAVGHPVAINPGEELAAAADSRGWPILLTHTRPGRLDPMPAVRTAAMYGSLVGAGIAGIALGIVSKNKRKGVDFATAIFGQVASTVGALDLEVAGEANLWKQRPAVFLLNHQSSLVDLVVVSSLLRGGATAVAKKEASRIPVLGQLLSLADFAFVDRADGTQARESMDEAHARLRSGTSVVIAPEGTRSLTPGVGPFKKGAFHLAMQAEVPIVPIVIRNAGEIMWRNAKTARPGVIQVRVLDPIPTVGWSKEDLDQAVESVRQQYVDTLEDWAGPDGTSR